MVQAAGDVHAATSGAARGLVWSREVAAPSFDGGHTAAALADATAKAVVAAVQRSVHGGAPVASTLPAAHTLGTC